RSRPRRTCRYRTDPPSVMRTAIAMMARSGDSSNSAVAATVTSIARLRKPDKPASDLCRLKLGDPAFRFDAGPFRDEFPNPGLEGFTRKCLHPASDLLRRPSHQFEFTDCTHNVIRVLLREKNSICPILNNFRRAARSKCDNRAATGLRLNRHNPEILAGRDDQALRAAIQVPQFVAAHPT